MIDPVEPELRDIILFACRDIAGGALTVHRTGDLAGIVVSNHADVPASSVALTREDRAGLIRVLIELQEVEGLK